jgi:hypothetical protein
VTVTYDADTGTISGSTAGAYRLTATVTDVTETGTAGVSVAFTEPTPASVDPVDPTPTDPEEPAPVDPVEEQSPMDLEPEQPTEPSPEPELPTEPTPE